MDDESGESMEPMEETLHQQNSPVLNWSLRLMQVDLYNGHKMVIVCKYPMCRMLL